MIRLTDIAPYVSKPANSIATVSQIPNSSFGSLRIPNHGVFGDTMSRTVFAAASIRAVDAGDLGLEIVGAMVAGPDASGAPRDGPRVVGAPTGGGASGGRIVRRSGLHDASTGMSRRAPSETNHTRWREIADPSP
jgi:hypothetical protein